MGERIKNPQPFRIRLLLIAALASELQSPTQLLMGPLKLLSPMHMAKLLGLPISREVGEAVAEAVAEAVVVAEAEAVVVAEAEAVAEAAVAEAEVELTMVPLRA
jgi:hypothetical protein